uniref:Uncharacterized protein n=1 Tax=Tanacetum cinerariifolium TaxID=118510 RepID=A0A699IC97_TANCI|nr:hypothetical protein [Tanacetum cinerariifolium]
MASSCCSSNVTPTPILDGIIALSAIHEMESKSDKDAWKDAIDCFKETKDSILVIAISIKEPFSAAFCFT